jgi:hypothetical protein
MEKQTIITVKISENLWHKARLKALDERKTMAQWLSESIELKLKEK